MKLLLDLQGAQCQSRHRGIGRYTLALSRAFLERAVQQHDVRLLFNTRFDTPTDSLIATFGKHALPEQRVMLEVPEGIRAQPGGNAWLRQAAARTMRHAIECLDADIVWHSSVLEGYVDDAVLPDTRPSGVASVATLYDLIPLHNADEYLGHPRVRQWYEQSVEILRRSDRLFAISEWVRQDAIQRLGLSPERVVTIGAAVDASFTPADPDPLASGELHRRYGIARPFVLYNGGFDPRKNVAALIHAFATLPQALRAAHQLVIVGRTKQEEMARLTAVMRKAQLPVDSVVYTGFVPDSDLVRLYTECALFVFPSLMEGFGLPPLEAMACGAPVIASDAASLSEVIGRRDALFDPKRIESISERMAAVLGDQAFAVELHKYGPKHAASFSWDAVASRALDAIQVLVDHRRSINSVTRRQLRPALACILAAGTSAPAWLNELGAPTISAPKMPDDDNQPWTVPDTERVLYITEPGTARSLEKIMQMRPGTLLVQTGQRVASTPPDAGTLHAAYKGNGYPGLLALWNGHAETVELGLTPLLDNALGVLCTDESLARQIRAQAKAMSLPDIVVLPAHETSQACMQQLEHDYCTHPLAREADLLDDLDAIEGKPDDDALAAIATAVVAARGPNIVRKWLVDVSSIAENDIRTGIQRVVRNILSHWLRAAPSGVRIEPVRFSSGRYHYARRYTLDLLDLEDVSLPEDAVDVASGDSFIGLDWAINNIAAAEPQLRAWHQRGVNMHFIVNDLLPINLPDMFHPYARGRFEDWLRRIASIADRLICISQATANDLRRWLPSAALHYQFGIAPVIGHFPLGVDATLGNTASTPRPQLVDAMQARPTLLMVGTIEPRKGYDQALDACDHLWKTGADFNLVIVGHFGWLMEMLRTRLEQHSRRNQHVFWIDDANDAELDAIYRASSALLAASWGEGYGLPLIEAARRGLPVIARDLPVFREVMGEHAYYFIAPTAMDLADALHSWLAAPSPHRACAVAQWPSWEQSAARLADVIGIANHSG
jgi:glycosyltransferase involved in cell wall biosynthesis